MATRRNKDKELALDLGEIYNSEPLSAALQGLYAEMGISGEGQAYVVVHKALEEGDEARIWKGAPDQYDLDALSKRFGSGRYVVRVYVQGEGGRYACRGTSSFHMLLDAEEEARAAARRNPAAASSSGGGLDIVTLLQASQKSMMDMLTPLLAGLNNRTSAIADLKGLAETLGVIKPGGNDPMKLFEQFARFQEITRAIGGGGRERVTEDELGPNSLLYKALEAFTETVRGVKAQEATALAGRAPPLAAAEHQVNPEGEDVKAQLERLVDAATKKRSTEIYGALIFEEAPDEVLASLIEEDWFAQLCVLEPRAAQHQEWFSQVRAEVVKIMKAEGLLNEKGSTLNNGAASVSAHGGSQASTGA